jgi:hypothetical protein
VPSHPSGKNDGGTKSKQAQVTKRKPSRKRPPPTRKPKARRSKDAAAAPTARASRPPVGPVIDEPFRDDFQRAAPGPNWYTLSPNWRIDDGQLCVQGARNRGAWLMRRLPVNARIEFEAVSSSDDGDIKAEFWGDGRSGATQTSYTNATSYLTIFGGWKNRFHVLARIDEHAPDRLQVKLKPDAVHERQRPVVPGRLYSFRVERADGKTVSWWVDGHLIHRLVDDEPLRGKGHEHFGFNNWDVRVCFDNLEITPL